MSGGAHIWGFCSRSCSRSNRFSLRSITLETAESLSPPTPTIEIYDPVDPLERRPKSRIHARASRRENSRVACPSPSLIRLFWNPQFFSSHQSASILIMWHEIYYLAWHLATISIPFPLRNSISASLNWILISKHQEETAFADGEKDFPFMRSHFGTKLQKNLLKSPKNCVRLISGRTATSSARFTSTRSAASFTSFTRSSSASPSTWQCRSPSSDTEPCGAPSSTTTAARPTGIWVGTSEQIGGDMTTRALGPGSSLNYNMGCQVTIDMMVE